MTLPNHDSLSETIVRSGFCATGGVRVPGNPIARLAFYEFVVRVGQDGLLRLENILRRGDS